MSLFTHVDTREHTLDARDFLSSLFEATLMSPYYEDSGPGDDRPTPPDPGTSSDTLADFGTLTYRDERDWTYSFRDRNITLSYSSTDGVVTLLLSGVGISERDTHTFVSLREGLLENVLDGLTVQPVSATDRQIDDCDGNRSLYWGRLPGRYVARGGTFELNTTVGDVGLECDHRLAVSGVENIIACHTSHQLVVGFAWNLMTYVASNSKQSERVDPRIARGFLDFFELYREFSSDSEAQGSFVRAVDTEVFDLGDGESCRPYETLDTLLTAAELAQGREFDALSAFTNTHWTDAYDVLLQKILESFYFNDALHDFPYDCSFSDLNHYSDRGVFQVLSRCVGRFANKFGDTTLGHRLRITPAFPCLDLLFTHSTFRDYVTSSPTAAGVVTTMENRGFTTELFLSDPTAYDVLTRQETSLTSWEENFSRLASVLSDGSHAHPLFMRYRDGERTQVVDEEYRTSVIGEVNGLREDADPFTALDLVEGLLKAVEQRRQERHSHGHRVPGKLNDLRSLLIGLESQLDYGAMPTGGRAYSRVWHRNLEDLSLKEIMRCCAALGGDKEDLTFRALFNPTYIYLNHFIDGVSHQQGYSILKAGSVGDDNVLLAISPYETSQAFVTALGPAETRRYVLDSMVRTAHLSGSRYLMIDDIDVKVRYADGREVRHVEGEVVDPGDGRYSSATPLLISYNNGKGCAPRAFRDYMLRLTRNSSAVTHEDVVYNPIEGEEELMREQIASGFEKLSDFTTLIAEEEEADDNMDDVHRMIREFNMTLSNLKENAWHYGIQNVIHEYVPGRDYFNLTDDETKAIIDQGYRSMKGTTRTVFKVGVDEYIKQRRREGVDLLSVEETYMGG